MSINLPNSRPPPKRRLPPRRQWRVPRPLPRPSLPPRNPSSWVSWSATSRSWAHPAPSLRESPTSATTKHVLTDATWPHSRQNATRKYSTRVLLLRLWHWPFKLPEPATQFPPLPLPLPASASIVFLFILLSSLHHRYAIIQTKATRKLPASCTCVLYKCGPDHSDD